MRMCRAIVVLIGILACAIVTNAEASHPSYLILQGPVAPNPHHTSQGYYPGHGYAVQPQAYSYGWFGAQPKRQWTRHNGYYRNYTEWSAR
ncbi:MAG: hypothetical protein O3C40_05665 [Planctomycetota bacterium]|nr:hypothetical protein [Planctomycetota bacterium]